MTPALPIARGAAIEYSELALGGPLVENPTTSTVGLTTSVVIDGNGDRVGLVFVNGGAADVFIWLDTTVSTSIGVRLTANGGSATLTVRDDFTLVTRKWFGISSGAGNTVSVLELARFKKVQALAKV